jgi:thiol:disulfide interchange protein DsbD
MRHIALTALLVLALAIARPGAADAPKPGGIDALLAGAHSNQDDFLTAEQAFHFGASADGSDRVRLSWQVTKGYYLYRARITVKTPSREVQLGAVEFPAGEVKSDEYFGKQVVYHSDFAAILPIARQESGTLQVPLEVSYQGCAEKGLCYPPVHQNVTVTLGPGSGGAGLTGSTGGGPGAGLSDQDWFGSLVRGGNLWSMVFYFYLAGLGLSLTPCVLPMVPILSGIIAGGSRPASSGRSFALSVAYVLGMAFTYTLAGIACAAAGRQVQAVFQQWWVLTVFAALFVAMAFSMFGFFTVQMPAFIQTRVAELSNRQSAGTLGGVAVMGALSALIVTTCVGPALVGALVVISQTGQLLKGGAALFAMSIGMGTPLLAIGASAGRLLPKAGPWMDLVKKLFGAMMLAVAVWMLARIVPERLTLLLWAVPVLVAAWLLWFSTPQRGGSRIGLRAAGSVACLYGLVLLSGAALGGSDPLAPIPALAGQHRTLEFQRVHSVDELDRAVSAAHAAGHGVMVDFTAEWCTSCKEMERYTFTDPSVQSALARAVLLRADVTADDAQDQALLKRLDIKGPPTIAFFGPDGQERAAFRVVGFMKADAFAAHSRAALHAS